MLPEIAQPQRERLFHIDFRAWFLGRLTRQDLTARFGLSEAAATRDIALYRSLAEGNLDFDQSSKVYRCSDRFRPLFEHEPQRTLVAITEGIGDDMVGAAVPHVRAEHPHRAAEQRRRDRQIILDHQGPIPAPVKDRLPAAPVALEHSDLGRAQRKRIARGVQVAGMDPHMRHLRRVAAIHGFDQFGARQVAQEPFGIGAPRCAGRHVDDQRVHAPQ